MLFGNGGEAVIVLRAPKARPTDREPVDTYPPPATVNRLRGWVSWLAAGIVLMMACGSGCAEIVWFETPSVTTAPRRVAAVLAAHHDPSDKGIVGDRLAAAVLATEDSRFYRDPALDPAGVARAAWGEMSDNPREAGATIELQLAKMLYTDGRSSLTDQMEQVVLAFKLDARFSKAQILAMYLDAAYFGDGAYGIVDASRLYFAVSPADLSWGQASLLAGLLQAPSAYSPTRHLRAALHRQGQVLLRLREVGALSPTQVEQINSTALRFAVPVGG